MLQYSSSAGLPFWSFWLMEASSVESATAGCILKEMANKGFTEADSDEFWDDMMDLRKAKNIR